MVVTKHSRLTLYPLRISKDKKGFIVEDTLSGEFYEMPTICIDAISMLNEGQLLYQIEEVLKDKYPEEDVDIESFIEDLLELGLVECLDGEIIPKKTKVKQKNNGLSWISPRIGRFFFNRYSTILYVFAILASIVLLIVKPELFPVYNDVFLFDLMIYNILVFLSISFLLVLVHEIGHVLAVRAEGLPTKIELGHRLFFIVLETDMSRVWSLQPEKRYRLYLAGMYFDAGVMFLALISQLIFAGHGYVVGISKVIVVSTFIRIIYQFCVYMKTDLYYVLENWSGCYNLMESGQSFLKRWFPYNQTDKKSPMFKSEEKWVRPYAIFYLVGVMVTIAITAFYNVPLIVHAGLLVMPGFLEPATSILFWDAAVFFFQFILMFGLLAYSYTKKYRENQQRQPL
ncbi:hypothetical protein SAMN05192533_10789 [Mesobacillus persicus]|uniref:Peptide zinc metalloprotease protein n=1 Tax=Mesobacillus persicus TaxID=930146 RepID=A0A1H8CJL2_9BACI|nr:hypothetical protein [Mesobacillus persicus]SEM94458.1 hypothetical protein SAMN05192533_10789 [Mesobacillus persicus]